MSHKRNIPCSCGSGRKFKHCCWGEQEVASAAPSRRPLNGLWVALGVVVIGPAIAVLVWSQRPAEPEARPAPIRLIGEDSGASVPSPYFYDRANNRHWDPDHGHWHNGPPPIGER